MKNTSGELGQTVDIRVHFYSAILKNLSISSQDYIPIESYPSRSLELAVHVYSFNTFTDVLDINIWYFHVKPALYNTAIT